MKRINGLSLAIGISCVIIAVILYMFYTIQTENRQDVIYVVSKTNSENSTFWHSVERGVKVAADELGVEVIFVGPEREIDLEDQINLVRKGIELKPMAIILAASDYSQLAQVANEVLDENITFVTLDSDVDVQRNHSFIATNNLEESKAIGHYMASLVGEEGEIGIISHLEGTTSAIDREEGFRQSIGMYKNMHIIDEIPYSNNDSNVAYEKTLSFVKAHPQVKGLFGTNEATLIGMAKAIKMLGMKDQITVLGFDISDTAAMYLEEDVIKAIIVQRPFNMGYLSVQEAYKQAKYDKSYEKIDVEAVLVTKKNMFDEENQKFIIPFLE